MPPQEKTLVEKRYPKPEPCLFSVRLALILVGFLAGVFVAGLRTAAGAYLISYWQWPEAIAMAVCVETSEVAFLLRHIWLKEQAKQDLLSTLGMALGPAISVAFSVLLAFVAKDRLPASIQEIAQGVVLVASVGVNVLTYLASRELAQYVVEHEVEHYKWAEDKLEWENRQLVYAERRRKKAVQKAKAAEPPRTRTEREAVMLRMYADKEEWPVSALCAAVNYGRTAMYAMRTDLVERGLLWPTPEGGFTTNHQEGVK